MTLKHQAIQYIVMSRMQISTRTAVQRLITPPVLAVAIILCGVAATFLVAHKNGDFWYSDAPRHAMDGAFILDIFKHLIHAPLETAKRYAEDYYLQYPALTILFYPPLFPVIEAFFFGFFGVSHWVAQLTVSGFTLAAAIGAFLLARRWLSLWQSVAIVLFFLGSHEVALWARQIMLDIPAYAFLLLSVYAYFRFQDSNKTRHLLASAILLCCGLYTKQTIVFILAPIIYSVSRHRGPAFWLERRTWYIVGLAFLLMIPLAVQTAMFGHFNALQAITGAGSSGGSRFSLENWTYYLAALPSQLGWPIVILAACYIVMAVLRLKRLLPAADLRFLALWLLAGYLFFSLISLKDPRFSLPATFPLYIFAALALNAMFPRRFATASLLIISAAEFGYTMIYDPVPYMKGYKEAANYIASQAPRNSVILFSGYRDGSFIFNLRTHEERRDLSVLRSDKLLLKTTVDRSFGITPKENISAPALIAMLDKYGVRYIVNQPNFWDDLPPMQALQTALHSDQFKAVKTISIKSNVYHEDRELVIYQNMRARSARQPLSIDLPLIGETIHGKK